MTVKTSAARCNFDFLGTHVAITGGGQGLGRAYAKAFAAAGATVFILDRNFKSACHVIDEIKAADSTAFAYHLDVGRLDDVSDVFNTIINEHGRIDVLVNNAAIFTTLEMKPFYSIDPAEWGEVINVNLNGVYACSRQVVDTMKENGFGRIINIGSAAVTMGRPNYTHYVASKSALIGMSRSMARELGSFGITVNTIMPGATFTEVERKTVTPQQKEAIVASQCIQRPATPNDILGTVLFLCSEESGFLTGQAITIDGGATHS